VKAADEFTDKTTALNHLQAAFSYLLATAVEQTWFGAIFEKAIAALAQLSFYLLSIAGCGLICS
jgi:hypothetical protein